MDVCFGVIGGGSPVLTDRAWQPPGVGVSVATCVSELSGSSVEDV